MEKKIKSLKELTTKVNELSKEYSMDDFTKSFKRRLSRMKIRFWESMAENRGLVNPVHAILTAKNSLSDDQMMKVLRVMEDLKEKYKYDEYMEKCDKLRDQFLSDRSDYFASKMGKSLTLEYEACMKFRFLIPLAWKALITNVEAYTKRPIPQSTCAILLFNGRPTMWTSPMPSKMKPARRSPMPA